MYYYYCYNAMQNYGEVNQQIRRKKNKKSLEIVPNPWFGGTWGRGWAISVARL